MPAIRPGAADDAGVLLDLLDEAIAWLVARGQTGQWGSEPFSTSPQRAGQIRQMAADGSLFVAEDPDGTPVGALIVGARLPYAPEAEEPELYVRLLITSRRHAGRGIGSQLVGRALDEARAAGADLVRVDCWAGAPRLVAWYEEQGVVPVQPLTVQIPGGEWHGQLFELRL
jgi:GNAT superfamily N-acetyltransferase